MVLETTHAREQYIGNGIATSFPVPFVFYDATDLDVIVSDLDGANAQGLQLHADYSVTGGEGAAGEVLLSGPLDGTKRLTIIRRLQITQPTNFGVLEEIDLDLHEREFDRGRMIDQQLQEQIDRCIKAPVTKPDALTFEDIVAERAAAQGAANAAGEARDVALGARNAAQAAQAGAETAEDGAMLAQAAAENARDIAQSAISTAGKAPHEVVLEAGQTAINAIPWSWTVGHLEVVVGGVQQPVTAYSEDVENRTVTLASAPGAGVVVTIAARDVLALSEGGGGGSVTWDEVAGKPSVFPPTPHAHGLEDVDGLDVALADKADTAHDHDGEYSQLGHTHDYAAASHGHAISDVTGLQTALDGKAASAHDHSGVYEPELAADRKRKITASTSDPTGGEDGDVWLKYSAT